MASSRRAMSVSQARAKSVQTTTLGTTTFVSTLRVNATSASSNPAKTSGFLAFLSLFKSTEVPCKRDEPKAKIFKTSILFEGSSVLFITATSEDAEDDETAKSRV